MTNTGAGTNVHPLGPVGYGLTALVLAGGSSGVNNILKALGFRSALTPAQAVLKPPPSQAWIAVRLLRKLAVGDVEVMVDQGAGPQLAGLIKGMTSPAPAFRGFLVDRCRFPMVAGYEVPGGSNVTVTLNGRSAAGQPVSIAWGPQPLAAGAMVDLDLTL